MKPRLLDLFCGAGGAAMGYHRAGFEVVGVDIKPQPHYPFEFWQADALDYLAFTGRDVAPMFDAVHASPPCQRYSVLTRNPENHPDLIGPVRTLLEQTGLPYVIENVPPAPLRRDLVLHGGMFGLRVHRRRVFESNCLLLSVVAPRAADPVGVYGHAGGRSTRDGEKGRGSTEAWREAMGIDWMTGKELAEAIPPAYTEFIGEQLMAQITVAA